MVPPTSEDLCWAIIRMVPFMSIDSVVAFTGVSRRKILYILALHHATGNVIKQPDSRKLGRHRLLTPEDVAVSRFSILNNIRIDTYTFQFLQGKISQSCDTYLDELREELEQKCGVSVSPATVWRALQRSGHTMKKVRHCKSPRSIP
jgi:transposase